MTPEIKIREIASKGIMIKSNLPNTDFVVNPYIGCQHGCIYCYAEFMKRFTDHHEPWGEFVDVKINAPDLIKNGRYKGKTVLFSSVTDPYQPLEAKYKLTRRILEKLVDEQPILEILTKSRMVTRDIDVLKKFDNVTVGVSLSTLNERYSRELEPMAALPRLRIETIKHCKDAGLPTYVFLSPIFPFITEIEEIIEQTADFVDFLMFENLNVRPTNRKKIYAFLERNNPSLVSKYNEIYGPQTAYWDNLKETIERLCKSCNKEARIHFHHGGFKK